MNISAFLLSETRAVDVGEDQRVDHLSSLPLELLDYIFELVSDSHDLVSMPPSKRLLRSHQRALYRYVRIRNDKQLVRLAQTLKSDAQKGSHTKSISWSDEFDIFYPEAKHLKRILKRLPNVLSIDFGLNSRIILDRISCDPRFRGYAVGLTTCRLLGVTIEWSTVDWLRQIPTLRRVEVSRLVSSVGMVLEGLGTEVPVSAPQVVEFAINTPFYSERDWWPAPVKDPSELRCFFPLARLVSIEIHITDGLYSSSLPPFLAQLGSPEVRSLKITDRKRVFPNVDVNQLLRSFPRLTHLHLDPTLYQGSIPFHLTSLTDLTSLSLLYTNAARSPADLITKLQHLPSLRLLTIEYFPIEAGGVFDIQLAEDQAEEMELDSEDLEVPTLEVLDGFSSMEGWVLPFAWACSKRILEVGEMEKRAEEIGIEVRSNLGELLRAFHRQLIEYHSRGIGELYFYKYAVNLDHSYELAAEHGLQLPSLELDSSELQLFDRDELDWFKVDMNGIVGDDTGECVGLSLRLK